MNNGEKIKKMIGDDEVIVTNQSFFINPKA
jgi:hypothetical protein